MSQLKYPVYAVLLLVFFATAAVALHRLSQVEFIAQKPTVIDYVEEPKAETVTVNAEGKTLFAANCAACHALDKIICGPALRTAGSRGPWVDRKNLTAWIKNPAATVAKFQYAKDLVAQFNGQMMPPFSHLTDAQIEAILEYLKEPPSYYAVQTVAK